MEPKANELIARLHYLGMHACAFHFFIQIQIQFPVFTPVPSVTSSHAAGRPFVFVVHHGHIGASHYHCWTLAPVAVARPPPGAQVSRHELPRTTHDGESGWGAMRIRAQQQSKSCGKLDQAHCG
jgi:hypothetical protein